MYNCQQGLLKGNIHQVQRVSNLIPMARLGIQEYSAGQKFHTFNVIFRGLYSDTYGPISVLKVRIFLEFGVTL